MCLRGDGGHLSAIPLVSARTVPESFAQGNRVAGPWWVVASTTSTAASTISPPLRSRTLRAPTGAATLASGLAGLTATAVSVGWVACRAQHAVHTRMARALQLLTCQQATSQQVVVCTTTTVPGTGRLPSKHPCQGQPCVEVRHGSRCWSVLLLRAWVPRSLLQETPVHHSPVSQRQLAQRAVPAWLCCDRLWSERTSSPVESSVWLRGDEGAWKWLCLRLRLR